MKTTAAEIPAAKRIASIDIVRGLVMLLMLLDHSREFLTEGNGIDPLDISSSFPALFLTRWITHLCAPVFVVLTGVSAWLARRDGRQLALRGLFLVGLELLVTSALWGRVVFAGAVLLQVIWAIGLSMLVLAAVSRAPRRVLLPAALSVIVLHSALPAIDGLPAPLQLLWDIFHQRGTVNLGGFSVEVLYPVLPWAAVMVLGWCLGPLFTGEGARRRRILALAGMAALGTFVVLRVLNVYGDPLVWQPHQDAAQTILSFINVEKYPPSLHYLLVFLGIGLLLLAAFDTVSKRGFFSDLGRTPLYFYITHLLCLIATVAVLWAVSGANMPFYFPLWAAWIVAAALAPCTWLLCRMYARLKFRPNAPAWTRYL